MLLGQFTVPTGQPFSGLLNARGKSMHLIGVDPPPLDADWTVYCVAFGTEYRRSARKPSGSSSLSPAIATSGSPPFGSCSVPQGPTP